MKIETFWTKTRMAIARHGGISFHELAATDIFEFFIILNQLETSLKKQAEAIKKKK